jgi:hypothetical protein
MIFTRETRHMVSMVTILTKNPYATPPHYPTVGRFPNYLHFISALVFPKNIAAFCTEQPRFGSLPQWHVRHRSARIGATRSSKKSPAYNDEATAANRIEVNTVQA